MQQFAGINVGEEELKAIYSFEKEHLKCAKGNGLLQFIVTPNGMGCKIEIRCIECNTIKDITTGETRF